MLRRSPSPATTLLPRLAAAVLLCSVATWTPAAAEGAGAEEVVEATGVATVRDGDAAAARDRAIDDALRKAVEQTVGTFVESETMVQNHKVLSDSIYSRSEGFVRRYEVLSEGQDGSLFRVKISAVVASGDLKGDVEALGLLLGRMNWPRVIVVIPEENLDAGGGSQSVGTVEAALIRSLRDKDFPVLDSATVRAAIDRDATRRAAEGDAAAAEIIRRQTGAELLVTGSASAQEAGSVAGTQMKSYQARATCRAVKLDSGEILASASGNGRAVHLNAAAGGNEALSQAASELSTDLVAQIAEQWAKETSGSRVIALTVSGLSRGQVDSLVGRLKREVRGVVDVTSREFSGELARLDIRLKGDAELLVQALEGVPMTGGVLRVVSASANKIDVRLDTPGS